MKAQAIFSLSLVLLGAISTNSLNKRSLLTESGRGHPGHHHQPQRHRLAQGRRRAGGGRAIPGARRAARDGDHHENARAITTGYLPAAADDYDYNDLAGYNSGHSATTRDQSSTLPDYSVVPQPGYEGDTQDLAQSQYGEEETTTTEIPETRDAEENASGDSA